MDKRHLSFWLVAAVIWFGWIKYMEIMYPPKKRPAKPALTQKSDTPADEKRAAEGTPEPGQPDAEKAPVADADSKTPKEPAIEPLPDEQAVPERNDLVLGIDRPAGKPGKAPDCEIYAELTNRGAAVTYLQLNRYRNEKRDGPLVLLGAKGRGPDPQGFDSFLLGLRGSTELQRKNWEVVASTPEQVTFRTTALQGKVQVEKRFHLSKDRPVIDLEVALKNLTDEPLEKDLVYSLTSGNGLPIEGQWFTRYFRRAVVAQVPVNRTAPYLEEQTAAQLIGLVEKGKKLPEYSVAPLQFAGVVSQYFASLVAQKQNPLEHRLIAQAEPLILERNVKAELSNITMRVVSSPASIPPGGDVVHQYLLYNGPKDPEILEPFSKYQLPLVIHYPNFIGIPIGTIARFMVWIVNSLYGLVGDYGIAIILLTVLVRGSMFPLSLKQQQSMQKMQALQPQMQEIKEKFAGDKEKLNRAMMDLYAKNKVNPFGGCLVLLLQFPIFIGLWQSLYNAFSLRQSVFLYGFTWIDDLAAPDQLFAFGMQVPFLGPYFNVLPILAVVQMVLQMHYMSPPATTPEAAMQQRMMKYMMVFFGFLFYSVPAGLCVYIITSGLWSMAERKLLPKPQLSAASPASAPAAAGTGEASWKTPVKQKRKGKPRK